MATNELANRLRGVDLNLLVYFRALWEYRNTTAAAESLSTSQPAVSAALKRLRLQFADALFSWDGKRMQPTPRAEMLAPQILHCLTEIEGFSLVGGAGDDGAGRNFIIASIDYVFADLGANFTNYVFERFPRLHLSLINFKPSMITHLRTLDVDIAIIPEEIASSSGLSRSLLFEDEYLLVRSSKFDPPTSLEEFRLREKVRFSAHPLEIVDHEIWADEPMPANDASQLLLPGQNLIPTFLSGNNRVALMTRRMLRTSKLSEDIVAEPPAFEVPPLRVSLAWHRSRNHELIHKIVRDRLIASFNKSDGL